MLKAKWMFGNLKLIFPIDNTKAKDITVLKQVFLWSIWDPHWSKAGKHYILGGFYLAGRQNASSSPRGPREDVCFDLIIVLKHICSCLLPVCNPTDTGSYISRLFSRFIHHTLAVELFNTIKRKHWNDWIYPSHCCSAWYRTDSFQRCVCVCMPVSGRGEDRAPHCLHRQQR